MKSFTGLLEKKAKESGNIACLGMDPLIEKIPLQEKNVEKKILKFYSDILEACISASAIPAAVKPNYAFFAQYGFPGLRALKKTIRLCSKKKLIVILDAKRADIGKTSEALAREAFDFWKADAVTVAPYMGKDSIEPFLVFSSMGKGVYVLLRTSNPSSSDFQQLETGGKKVYMKVAEKIVEWHVDGLGAVVGATNPSELGEIQSFLSGSGNKIPLLIPGVGTQGGSAPDVMKVLSNPAIHRINSSGSINFAYEKNGSSDYAGSAANALRELISQATLLN